MLRYAYYPGCAAKGAAPELHQSTMRVVERLGIAVVELTRFNCCGAGVISEADPDLAYLLNARTLATAEALHLDIMTVCGTCQGILGGINKRLQEDHALRGRINQGLQETTGLSYGGGVEVKHLQWILVKDFGVDALARYITHPLTQLSVAPFYGCYILRPSDATGFDDAEDPTSLEKLILAIGARPVAYEGRTQCCGFPVFFEKEAIATNMVGKHLQEAATKGSDLMVTPCPLCHMSLDISQSRAKETLQKEYGLEEGMPILHLPQLLGLAMGFSEKELGLKRHLTSTKSLMTKIKEIRSCQT